MTTIFTTTKQVVFGAAVAAAAFVGVLGPATAMHADTTHAALETGSASRQTLATDTVSGGALELSTGSQQAFQADSGSTQVLATSTTPATFERQ